MSRCPVGLSLVLAVLCSSVVEAQRAPSHTEVAVRYHVAAGSRGAKPVGPVASYPDVVVHNYAPFGLQIWVHYSVCDTKWLPVSTGKIDSAGRTTPGGMSPSYMSGQNACLITKITVEADAGAPSVQISPYMSSGTSYRTFYFLPAPPEQEIVKGVPKYWQLYSQAEASIPDQGVTGKSPGFVITNKTQWPVAVSLDQVGCLYHDALKPGASMNRTTGAVWFTMTAQIVPDGVDPNSDLSCAIPIIEVVADVLEAVMTAGVVSWAGLTESAVIESVGPMGAKLIPMSVVRGATVAAGKGILSSQMDNIMSLLRPHQVATKPGQYAGPPWPFRCDQKPTYEITGGWGKTGYTADGFWIDPGSPLVITKTNTCGSSMMR